MARLTLSEQVNALASEKAELTAKVHALTAHCEQQGVTAQLLREELTTLRERANQVSDLEKKLKEAESMKKYYSEQASGYASELEQAHAVLDGVAGAPSREFEGEYGKVKRNVVTRLAGAFIAFARGAAV